MFKVQVLQNFRTIGPQYIVLVAQIDERKSSTRLYPIDLKFIRVAVTVLETLVLSK